MSIELVVDNSVAQFTGVNLGDVRQAMIAVAERIEKGEWGNVANGILILETENGLEQFHWGKLETAIEAIGLLELAKGALILSQLAGDGE